MITYQSEKFVECMEEMKPLIDDHYNEVGFKANEVELDVDYDKYVNLCNADILRIITARDGVELIGYFITFVNASLHHKDQIYAFNEALYIKKSYRGNLTAYNMIKYAINDLRSNCKVRVLCIHMKVKFPFRELLVKLGFSLSEENWEIEL